MDNSDITALDNSMADAARYGMEKTAANVFSATSANFTPSMVGGYLTMGNNNSGIIDGADMVNRLKSLEETSTHINVAKDQENRICELENAVTELMDFMKEQLKVIEENKKKIEEELEKAKSLHTAYTQYASNGGFGISQGVPGQIQSGLQNIQSAQMQAQVPSQLAIQSSHSTHDYIGIAKRALGLK